MGGTTNKGAQTRARILEAAAHIMDGGGEPTMAAVAQRAGVSKGSVYYYFDDSGQIAQEVVLGELDRIVTLFEKAAASAQSASDALRRITGAYIGLLKEDTPLVRLVFGRMHNPHPDGWDQAEIEALRDRLYRLVALQLVRGKAEGTVRPDIDPDLAGSAVIGVFLAMTAGRLDGCVSEGDYEILEHALLDFIGYGVAGTLP